MNNDFRELAAFVGSLSDGASFVPRWDPQYPASRQIYNGAATAQPLFIVYCATEGDVSACVRFATRTGLPLVARAGGHSLEGFSLVQGGLVVDVTRIDYVRIDSDRRTATVGAGVRSRNLATQLRPFGLHFPGSGDGGVGIAGVTLGGGFGPTSRQFGLACDNLLEVVYVNASGDLVTASRDLNPDVCWAHRGGGGGNFGIVVSMKLQLHELPQLYLVNAVWPIDQAVPVLGCWQDTYSMSAQTRLGLYGGLNKLYDSTGHVQTILGMAGVYVGSEADAQRALEPLLATGQPQVTLAQCTDYVGVLDHLFAYATPSGGYGSGSSHQVAAQKVKSAYAARAWTADEFKTLVDGYANGRQIAFVSLENYGGVVNGVDPGATAFPHRRSAFLVQTGVFWLKDADKEAAQSWLSGYFGQLAPALSDSVYVNYPDLDLADYLHCYYGPNLDRLRAVKAQVDPERVFTFAQAI